QRILRRKDKKGKRTAASRNIRLPQKCCRLCRCFRSVTKCTRRKRPFNLYVPAVLQRKRLFNLSELRCLSKILSGCIQSHSSHYKRGQVFNRKHFADNYSTSQPRPFK